MNYTRYDQITNQAAKDYFLTINEPRESVTMYELEHPPYDTEEDYGHILEAWVQNRVWWTKQNQDRGEYLPKPKRRPGRPLNREALLAKLKKEAEQEAARAARKARAQKREEALLRRSQSNKGVGNFTIGIPEDVLAELMLVKGDLSISDCVIEILRSVVTPKNTDGTT